MIRLKIALFIGTLALMVFGGDRIYQGLRFREPVVISYEEFVKQKPSAGWFRVKNAALSVLEETHFYRKGKTDDIAAVTEAFLPAYSAKRTKEEGKNLPVTLLVLTRDPDIIETIHEAGAMIGANAPSDRFLGYLMKNQKKFYIKRDIEGMMRSGLSSLGADETKELKSNNPTLESDFVTLEEGKKPTILLGGGLFALGGVLLVLQVLYYIGRRGGR